MTSAEIYAHLKQIAPNIAFSASRSPDLDEIWDGSGPDPSDEGFVAYDIEVTATAIVNGEAVEGTAYLGSCWMEDDEPIDDIHGYLPQKLEEAAEELVGLTPDGSPLRSQVKQVIEFLRAEMKRSYDAQRAQIEESRIS